MSLLSVFRYWWAHGRPRVEEFDPDILELRRRQHQQINEVQGLLGRDYLKQRDHWAERERDSWLPPQNDNP